MAAEKAPRRIQDYAPWHCWSQGHGWLRCLWIEFRNFARTGGRPWLT